MHSVSVAEWMVSRFTDRKRAASLVGDLVELRPQEGSLWFWLSLAGVVLSLIWRRLVAFVAAFYASNWAMSGSLMAIWGIHAPHRPPDTWWMESVSRAVSGVSTVLWMVLLYTAIRYGMRARLTQLALVWTAVMTAIIYGWWQPAILMACVVASFFTVTISLAHPLYRKAILALTIAIGTGISCGLLAMYLATCYQNFLVPGPMGDRELRAHPSISLVALGGYLLTVWMTAFVCSCTRRWWNQDRIPG